jgi:C-terminal processing protease CtpA/Prc
VFDLRGYAIPSHKVLTHLLTRPAVSRLWMAVPHVVRPDHVSASMVNWEVSGIELQPQPPHVGGRVAFVTGPAAANVAESVIGLVEHHHLGEIVGAATAGTIGNVAEVTEPSGCRTRFTGMRVTKPNGARQHLLGIQPTIPASRTIAGIVAGRDEVLDKALAYVRDASR